MFIGAMRANESAENWRRVSDRTLGTFRTSRGGGPGKGDSEGAAHKGRRKTKGS